MVKRCVRVYIEGGARGSIQDSDFRRGWKRFLNELHEIARSHGYHSLEIVRGMGRARTFASFTHHKMRFPNDLCVLLVDAEKSVPEGEHVWSVVARREGDNWSRPTWATERHLYLMVPFVETWLLTDTDALAQFFKRGFKADQIPTTNLENRSKDQIEQSLNTATRNSSKKAYKHGQAHEIIGIVRPERVKTLKHGRRLFELLGELIKGESEV